MMVDRRLCWLLLLLLSEEVSTDCNGTRFKWVSVKDYSPDVYLAYMTNVSLLECGDLCRENTCNSLSYFPSDDWCYIYGNRIWPGLGSEIRDDVMTYWRYEEGCPHDYKYSFQHSVCFKPYLDIKLNWTDAQTRCEEDDGHLFIANTVGKLELIYSVIEGDDILDPFIYVGGHTTFSGTECRWLDGNSSGFLWDAHEPTGWQHEQCLAVRLRNSTMRLDDHRCFFVHNFVCQVPV